MLPMIKMMTRSQARRQLEGQCPPDFRFCPPRFFFLPPDFFSYPPRYFFGRKKLVFLGGKNVKICDFGQKKPSDFGEDLFFWRSPAFGRKICNFGQKKPSHFGKNLCPPDFNFAPPISRSWRRPCTKSIVYSVSFNNFRVQQYTRTTANGKGELKSVNKEASFFINASTH